jgi:low affinity Fe/Cu permease
MSKRFSQLANFVAEVSGHPGVFGPSAATRRWFSDTWLLIMNTWTSVVTFLMVFLIQNSQNRDSSALQAKMNN